MNKILNIILVIGLLTLLFLPLIPAGQVEADSPYEQLAPDESRLNSYTKVVRVGGDASSGVYTATISSLPQTMPDLRTKITTEWTLKTGTDGVSYYESGTNLVYAKVTGTRITAQFENIQAAWDPTITIGGKILFLQSGPIVVDDPFNENYQGNTIKWEYAADLGWFIFSREYTVTRYLRQIEGCLQEIYKLPYNPKGDVTVDSNYDEEYGFTWDRPVTAWDSNSKIVSVHGDSELKTVFAGELGRSSVKYPVYIDPTTSFTTSSSDGYVWAKHSTSYSTVWAGTTGTVSASGIDMCIGQYYATDEFDDYYYWIFRAAVYFNTASLPDSATIDSATLQLYRSIDESDTDFYITIQSGMSTYPHDPLVAGDYNKVNYSGSGGTFSSSGWTSGYNSITLSTDGKNWINKIGYTKFLLRSGREISGVVPTGAEGVVSYSYEKGTGYQPKLSVTYTVPIVTPTINTYSATNIGETTATLKGYLTDDGGATCSVRFERGTTPGLDTYTGTYTSVQNGYGTGDSFQADVSGLLRGTTYYYTAEAQNSAGSSDIDEESFTTRPGAPTNFATTSGSHYNYLTWTKGEGSDKTLVRFSTTSFPTTTTSGTQIYLNTGTSYNHTSLTDGVTYYYSAWGEEAGLYSSSYATATGIPETLDKAIVTTNDATLVTSTTATLNGYLNSLSGYGTCDVWFQYYWGAGTWLDHEVPVVADVLTSPGSFSADTSEIGPLPVSTVIYFRAVGDNGDIGGEGYGSSNSFKTGDPSAPQMQTNIASGETKTVATLHGKVVDDGGVTVTAWFQWGTTTELGFETSTAADLFTDYTLHASLTDLTPSTTYYFRVVGDNEAGTGYGTVLNFTTAAPDLPSVLTLSASGVSATEATLKGQLTNDGGAPCKVRFEWGLNESLGTYTSWMEGYTSGQMFNYLLGSLNISETYYYQAEAENTGGSDEGEILYFTTVFGPPEDLMAYSLGTDSISLKWEKVGDQTGIFMKAGSFPVDRLDGKQVYFGTAESCSVGDLDEGTTYFFRAWSWRSGGTWSDEYTEQAATTGASSATTEPTDMGWGFPDAPDDYTQDPSGNAFEDWPFYDLIEDSTTASHLAPGSLWLIITLIFISALIVGLFVWSGNLLVVIIGGMALIVIAGMMGLIPTWIAAVFLVIGGGLGYVTKSA